MCEVSLWSIKKKKNVHKSFFSYEQLGAVTAL